MNQEADAMIGLIMSLLIYLGWRAIFSDWRADNRRRQAEAAVSSLAGESNIRLGDWTIRGDPGVLNQLIEQLLAETAGRITARADLVRNCHTPGLTPQWEAARRNATEARAQGLEEAAQIVIDVMSRLKPVQETVQPPAPPRDQLDPAGMPEERFIARLKCRLFHRRRHYRTSDDLLFCYLCSRRAHRLILRGEPRR